MNHNQNQVMPEENNIIKDFILSMKKIHNYPKPMFFTPKLYRENTIKGDDVLPPFVEEFKNTNLDLQLSTLKIKKERKLTLYDKERFVPKSQGWNRQGKRQHESRSRDRDGNSRSRSRNISRSRSRSRNKSRNSRQKKNYRK